MSDLKKISLYFTEGSSDKEYHAEIKAAGDKFVVEFRYGRRGGPLKAGLKTTAPVDYASAVKVYEKLVSEKTSKGYSTGTDGTPFEGTEKAGEVTGFVPQLLNEISEEEAESLILDDGWVMQEKMNGERRPVIIKHSVTGVNKKGLAAALPQPVFQALTSLPMDSEVDAEIIGDVLYVFDMTRMGSKDLRGLGFATRYAAAAALLGEDHPHLRLVPAAFTAESKRKLFDEVKARNGEGLVFKRKDAPYTPGRPNSGGTQLKLKFYASATCEVNGQNGDRRSVSLAVYDEDGKKVDVGNVTIPENHSIPKPGEFVEVRYLYAYKGGSLYQPIYEGPRTDQDRSDCGIAQLKYKPEDAKPAKKLKR